MCYANLECYLGIAAKVSFFATFTAKSTMMGIHCIRVDVTFVFITKCNLWLGRKFSCLGA